MPIAVAALCNAKKIFVLDTNILLHDPYAFAAFEDNCVVIPLTVIRELDRKKSEIDVIGANSRAVARELSKLAQETGENFSQGVTVNANDGKVVIFSAPPRENTSDVTADDTILDVCESLSYFFPRSPVTLITKDRYLQVIASYRGIVCEDYLTDRVALESVSLEHREVTCPRKTIASLYNHGFVYEEDLQLKETAPLSINECFTLRDESNPSSSALAIHTAGRKVELITAEHNKILNLKALNAEQRFAIRVLTDPSIHLITLSGETGSGKTILAIAAALEQIEKKLYSQAIITRTEVPVGESQGFLAGSIREKTDPWLAAMYGCIDQLVSCKDTGGKHEGAFKASDYKASDYYIQRGIVRPEAFAYIRGVTWMNSYIIVDESQNTLRKELKALITRAGGGEVPSKVVLLGDPLQIDKKYLDPYSNGLAAVIDRFKGWEHYAHIHLTKTVRSDLSREAGRRL